MHKKTSVVSTNLCALVHNSHECSITLVCLLCVVLCCFVLLLLLFCCFIVLLFCFVVLLLLLFCFVVLLLLLCCFVVLLLLFYCCCCFVVLLLLLFCYCFVVVFCDDLKLRIGGKLPHVQVFQQLNSCVKRRMMIFCVGLLP